VRHRSTHITNLLQDEAKIREERKKARQNRNKYIGIGSDSGRFGSKYGGMGYEDNDYSSPSFQDHDDIKEPNLGTSNGEEDAPLASPSRMLSGAEISASSRRHDYLQEHRNNQNTEKNYNRSPDQAKQLGSHMNESAVTEKEELAVKSPKIEFSKNASTAGKCSMLRISRIDVYFFTMV
jgi:hypothetical protein